MSANHGNCNVLGGQLLSLLLHVPQNNRGKKKQLATLIPRPTKREKRTLSLYDASIFLTLLHLERREMGGLEICISVDLSPSFTMESALVRVDFLKMPKQLMPDFHGS